MYAIATEVDARLESSMKAVETTGNTRIIYKTVASVTVANSMSEVKSTDHLIVFVDQVLGKNAKGGQAGGVAPLYGQIAYVETDNSYQGGLVETAIHELGHNMGLSHTFEDDIKGNDDDPDNYMSYSNNTHQFSIDQIRIVANNAQGGKLNKGDNYTKSPITDYPLINTTNEKPYKQVEKGQKMPKPVKN